MSLYQPPSPIQSQPSPGRESSPLGAAQQGATNEPLGEQGQLPEMVRQSLQTYWQERLAGLPEPWELPGSTPPPTMPSGQGATYRFTLPADLAARLLQLSQEQESSLFSLLLASYMACLFRYTGQRDLVVGTPVSQRASSEWQAVLGRFHHVLPVRVEVEPSESFRRLWDRVGEQLLSDLAHGDLPVEQIIDLVPAGQERTRLSLSQTQFVLTHDKPVSQTLFGPSSWRWPQCTQSARADVQLAITAAGAEWECEVFYAADLWQEEQAARLAVHWQELLRSLAADPQQPVWKLNLLSAGERVQVLEQWNQTRSAYAQEWGVHQLVSQQVARTPQAVAVTFQDRQLSYAALEAQATLWAGELRAHGIGPGTLVGIYLERSCDLLVSVLAIWKAGAAYVPLDPHHPPARVQQVMEDARLAAVLTHCDLRERLPAEAGKVVLLDELAAAASCMEFEQAAEQNDFEQLPAGDRRAYVLYTSGSTGRPKGVAIRHSSVVNFLQSMRREPGLGPEDVVLAVTTLGFDISVLELFLPLLVGAQVAMVSREVAQDAEQLAQELEHRGVTLMQATPATWQMLLESGWTGRPQMKVLCGGEAMLPSLAEAMLTRCGSLWNMYGPTETTVWSTLAQIKQATSRVPIGRPIANTQIYVLDEQQQPVPVGFVGQLYIAGAGVAEGYLHRPELTAERFVPDPFAVEPSARMYHTGDLARWWPDGQLEYLGRGDQQIKLRGYRVELGDIESALISHPRVHVAAVVAHAANSSAVQLVAFVVPLAGPPVAADELRAHLSERLPAYMVPARYQLLEQLPQTPNGKTDRQLLTRLAATAPVSEPTPDAPAPPQTSLEQRLATIWKEILGLPQIGCQDNFFEHGGNSLLAVRLAAEIQKQTGNHVPVRLIFRYPTVTTLAEALSADRTLEAGKLVHEVRAGRGDPVLLMPSITGADFPLYGLVNYLHADRPIWTLNPPTSADYGFSRQIEMEDIAAYYVDAICERITHQRLHLVGYSFGVYSAYELARQLLARGMAVGALVLIDLPAPKQPRSIGKVLTAVPRFFRGTSDMIRICRNVTFSELTVMMKESAQALARRILTRRSGPRSSEDMGFVFDGEFSHQLAETNFQAMLRYRGGSYAGGVTLLRARQRMLWDYLRPDLGWRDLAAAGVTIDCVPGDHESIRHEPHVAHLGRTVERSLSGAECADRN